MNIQHPTSNIQHPAPSRAGRFIGCSVLDVGCWMFLLFVFLSSTLSAQTSTNVLPPLAPAYLEMPPTFWEQHQSAIIVAGFAFLAVAFLFLRVWLRPETPVILPPDVLARQTLAKLQSQFEDRRLLSEVSQCLRHYVSEILHLSNHELTTAEFCSVIARNQQIGMELAETISNFLRECDVRKFSPANSATPLNAVNRALKLIALAEQETHRQDACATKNERRI